MFHRRWKADFRPEKSETKRNEERGKIAKTGHKRQKSEEISCSDVNANGRKSPTSNTVASPLERPPHTFHVNVITGCQSVGHDESEAEKENVRKETDDSHAEKWNATHHGWHGISLRERYQFVCMTWTWEELSSASLSNKNIIIIFIWERGDCQKNRHKEPSHRHRAHEQIAENGTTPRTKTNTKTKEKNVFKLRKTRNFVSFTEKWAQKVDGEKWFPSVAFACASLKRFCSRFAPFNSSTRPNIFRSMQFH